METRGQKVRTVIERTLMRERESKEEKSEEKREKKWEGKIEIQKMRR